MSRRHQDANQTPAPPRSRRGPAFSLNPFPPSSAGSQFATPPRFQFPDEPSAGDAVRGSGRSRPGFFRVFNRRYENISPSKGDKNISLQVSDDEIEDDFDHRKETRRDAEASTALDGFSFSQQRSNKRPRTSFHSSHGSVRTNHEIIDDDFEDDEINDSSTPIPDSPPSPPARSKARNVLSQLEPDREILNNELSPSEMFEPISEPQTPDHTSLHDDGHPSSKITSVSRSRPRFILSANYTPASTATPTTATPQQTRKKPAFVLPRSPSPDREDASSLAIPGPFSPVATRSLRRSGRPKASAATATYVPGGMAEQLRDWIMEANMKRKATSERHSHQKENNSRWSTIGKVDMCNNAFLKSSGPVLMAQVMPEVVGRDDLLDTLHDSQRTTILLLGVAASRSHINNGNRSSRGESALGEKLRRGDIVGVGPGLSWEIEIDPLTASETTHSGQVSGSHRVVPSSQSESEGEFEDEDEDEDANALPVSTHSARKTWLVAAEWDLLNQTD